MGTGVILGLAQMIAIEDYIVQIDSVLTPGECDQIVGMYKSKSAWKPHQPHHKHVTIDLRGDPEIEKRTAKAYAKILDGYKHKHRYFNAEKSARFHIQKYPAPVGMFEHVDGSVGRLRLLTTVIALNDDFEGGELAFWNGDISIRVPKGSAVAFPANFLFPHQVKQITSGTRFTLVRQYV